MRWRLWTFLFLGILLLLQFQNCSPVNGQLSADNGVALLPDARISDDWRTNPLMFSYKNLEVAEELSLNNFYGLCLRQTTDQPLTWTLKEDGQEVLQGSSTCSHGNFQIQIDDLQSLPCGIPHQLTVRDAALVASGSMTVTRRCPAIQRVEETNGCARERVLNPQGHAACEYVCYDHGVVVQKEPLSLDLCPAVAP